VDTGGGISEQDVYNSRNPVSSVRHILLMPSLLAISPKSKEKSHNL
jgi:hypothetical protein